jgi:hypothetical protein
MGQAEKLGFALASIDISQGRAEIPWFVASLYGLRADLTKCGLRLGLRADRTKYGRRADHIKAT